MQELTKLIRELVPELMELSFGCEVKVRGENTTDTVLSVAGNKVDVRTQYREDINIEDFEILGHPIQLHHVLKAIAKEEDEIKYFIDGDGFWYYWKDEELISVAMMNAWDMDKTLSEQSPETTAFLLSILKK